MNQKEYFRSHLAVLVLLEKDGKVLLGKRMNTKFGDGEYSLPGGHIDGNESASSAALRELKEEIGTEVLEKDLHISHIQHWKAPGREYVNFFFKAKEWVGEPQILEPDKCGDLAWFPLNKLPEKMSPNIKEGIINCTQNTFYSEFGWK